MKTTRSLLIAVAFISATAGAAVQEDASVRAVLDAPNSESAYNPVGRRDPFRPFTLDIRRTDNSAELTPLQRYELGQLTVVGTVWALQPPRAMIEDSVGMGYIVTLGTPIGRNGGVVTAIEPQRIVVEEHVLDFYGKEQVNRIVMETPKEEGSSQPARERK